MTSGPARVRVRVRVRCFRSVEQTTTCEQSPLITMPFGGSLIADAPPTSPNWYYLPRGQNVATGPSIWRRRMLTVRPSSAREPPGAFLGLQSTPTKISQLFTV